LIGPVIHAGPAFMQEVLRFVGLTVAYAGNMRDLFADTIRSYSAFITPSSFPRRRESSGNTGPGLMAFIDAN
jgi:hypothetical protein